MRNIIPILFLLAVGALLQTHNPNAVQDATEFVNMFTDWRVYALLLGALACVWFFVKVSFSAINASEKRKAEEEAAGWSKTIDAIDAQEKHNRVMEQIRFQQKTVEARRKAERGRP